MSKKKPSVHNGAAYPWMRPVWVRIAIVLVCAVWTGVETYFGDRLWSMVAAGVTGYGIWTFFITWQDDPAEEDSENA